MKKLIALVIATMMIPVLSYSQVSVNAVGNPPHASAMLDVQSNSKGLLIPRMTTSERTGIGGAAEGLMVYDTDLGRLFFYRSGVWRQYSLLDAAGASASQVAFWTSTGILSGNNNLYWDNTNARLGIGTAAPNQQLEIVGAFRFPATTSATTGVIYKGTTRFLHDFKGSGTAGNNTFLGADAGNFTMGGASPWHGSYNTGVGVLALTSLTTGSYNTAMGLAALRNTNTGEYNTAMGAYAMSFTTSGSSNTAVGYTALNTNTSGGSNIAIGMNALKWNSTGSNNTAVGVAAMLENTIAEYNTAVGSLALRVNTTAGQNVAVGRGAMYAQSYNNGGTAWSSNNVAVGYNALYNNQPTSTSTGMGNTALGCQANLSNTTGSYNTSLGYMAGNSANNYSNSTAIGYGANATANDQVRLGDNNIQSFYCMGAYNGTSSSAPNMVVNSNGQIMRSTETIPVGTGATGQVAYWSGSGTLTGNSSLFWDNTNARLGLGTTSPAQQLDMTGAFRLPVTSSPTTGVIYKGTDRFIHDYRQPGGLGCNTFIGVNAGNFTMSGTGGSASNNTATGNQSLTALTTGSENTANGFQALIANTSGGSNTAVGSKALYSNTSGISNVVIGKDAAYYTQTGGYNTIVGNQAGNGVSGNSYSNNTLIGYLAGNGLTTGGQNIFLGYGAGLLVTSGSNNIVIGYNASVPSATGNQQMVIGSQDLLYGDLQYNRIGIGTYTPGQKLEVKGGNVLLSSSGVAPELWLAEPSASGTNYTAFKAQAQAADLTYILPSAYGSNGYLLSTTATGTLSWVAPTTADITRVGSMTSGDVFYDATADDDWLGLGPAAGRIEFDDLTTDEVNILNANVGLGTSTPTQQLELTGNMKLPAPSATTGIIYMDTYTLLHRSGTRSVCLGGRSGNLSMSGAQNNSAVGDSSLVLITTGDNNVAVGFTALKKLTTSSGNTVIGSLAGNQIATNGWNTIIGYQAGKATTSDRNTFIGCEAGMSNTLGYYNVFLGLQAGYSNTTANYSTALGFRALYSQTGYTSFNTMMNTAVGYESMYTTNPTNTTNGRGNTAVGYQSLRTNSTGGYNTALGTGALYSNTTGASNTAVGGDALSLATSDNNTAIGDQAMYSVGSGARNTSVGASSMYSTTTGSDNTVIGYNAGLSSNAFSNSIAIGSSVNATNNDQVRLGPSSIQTLYCMGAFNGVVGQTNVDLFVDNTGKIGYVSSSARYKENISDMDEVEWLYHLRPVNFNYISDETNSNQYGLIAEEVEKVNADFVHYRNGQPETVSYSQMISPMIKAIQEQNTVIEQLKSEIEVMKTERQEMLSRLEALESSSKFK